MMKRMSHILSRLLLLLIVSATALPAAAYDFMAGGIAYNINSNGTSVTVTYEQEPDYNNVFTSYSNASGSLTIPSSVTHNGKTYSVTAIGYRAFQGCSGFTGALTIPNSVTSIGGGAFRNCSGFTGSLTIPESVTSIGGAAFADCSGFTGSLTIPNSVTDIGEYAFRNCSGFTGSLTIPNSVTSIANYAFHGCSGITDITVSSDLADIGGDAFSGTEWYNNQPDGIVYVGNVAYKYKGTVPDGSILTIRDGIKGIAGSAFERCSGFTGSLNIPNSVTTIGESAFAGCSGFTGSLNIPNSVTTIGSTAFLGCSGFTGSLNIPNSVREIGIGAFSRCSGFTGTLSIPNSVTEICLDTFFGCSGFTGSLTIPNSVTIIGPGAFSGCSGFTGSLTIPNSVTEIVQDAFSGCSGLNSLTLSGNGAWNNWPEGIGISISQFKTLNVGSGITELGDLGFNTDVLNSYAQVPPTCAENTFANYQAALHVPSESTVAYFTAPYWTNFGNIVNDIKEKMAIDQTEADLIVSQTLQLKASVTPSNLSNDIAWCSSNPKVAKVDDNGLVTSVSSGECDIFAYLSSNPAVYASCHIGSNPGIILDVTKATIAPNKILTITPKYDSAKTDIVASSSDTDVAIVRVVTIDGVKKVQVVGVNLGTATITVADSKNNAAPAICLVTVAELRNGDVNGDGNVDVDDLNLIINIMLDKASLADWPDADVDGNNNVDIDDLNTVINIMLGK